MHNAHTSQTQISEENNLKGETTGGENEEEEDLGKEDQRDSSDHNKQTDLRQDGSHAWSEGENQEEEQEGSEGEDQYTGPENHEEDWSDGDKQDHEYHEADDEVDYTGTNDEEDDGLSEEQENPSSTSETNSNAHPDPNAHTPKHDAHTQQSDILAASPDCIKELQQEDRTLETIRRRLDGELGEDRTTNAHFYYEGGLLLRSWKKPAWTIRAETVGAASGVQGSCSEASP